MLAVTHNHIAIFTLQGKGHVYPALSLVTHLVRRGYRVTAPTYHQYGWHFNGIGAQPVLYRNSHPSREVQDFFATTFNLPIDDPRRFAFPDSYYEYQSRHITEFLQQIIPFYQNSSNPDLVLYDQHFYAGRVAASRLHVPAIPISAHFAYYGEGTLWERGVGQNHRLLREFSSRIDDVLRANGIGEDISNRRVEDLNIHFIPRPFQYNAELFDKRFCFAGRSLDRPFSSVLKDNSEERVILISGLSGLEILPISTNEHFHTIIDALAESPYKCVLSVGERGDGTILDLEIPSNFTVNRTASNLELLPRAALLICHGGMGSTLDAISNGVPVLAIPSHAHADEVAYRAADLGLGIRLLRHGLSTAMLRDTVDKMLIDKGLSERVRSAKQVFRNSVKIEKAVDLIEQYLQTK